MGLSHTDSHLRVREALFTSLTRHSSTSEGQIKSLTYVSHPERHLKHKQA